MYQFDGKEKFIQQFDTTVRQPVKQIIDQSESTQMLAQLDHFEALAKFFLFDEDPQAEDLENEKQ